MAIKKKFVSDKVYDKIKRMDLDVDSKVTKFWGYDE
jgi:hypothetical protein